MELTSTNKIINLLMVIDTDKVKKDYKVPSKIPGSPTIIGTSYGGIVVSGTTVNNNSQGKANLDFNATSGDMVRAFAVSGSNNFDDAVLLYDMKHRSGEKVLGTFSYQPFEKSTVVPNGTAIVPATLAVTNFWFFQAGVAKSGQEFYQVQFALYERDNNGKPVLYGYFDWDPTITVPQTV